MRCSPSARWPGIIDRPIVNIDDAFELELAEWLLASHERLEAGETGETAAPIAVSS